MTRPASHHVIERRCATCKWLSFDGGRWRCHFPVNRYSIPQAVKNPDCETCDEWQAKETEKGTGT